VRAYRMDPDRGAYKGFDRSVHAFVESLVLCTVLSRLAAHYFVVTSPYITRRPLAIDLNSLHPIIAISYLRLSSAILSMWLHGHLPCPHPFMSTTFHTRRTSLNYIRTCMYATSSASRPLVSIPVSSPRTHSVQPEDCTRAVPDRYYIRIHEYQRSLAGELTMSYARKTLEPYWRCSLYGRINRRVQCCIRYGRRTRNYWLPAR
jgi:hypothetical protein